MSKQEREYRNDFTSERMKQWLAFVAGAFLPLRSKLSSKLSFTSIFFYKLYLHSFVIEKLLNIDVENKCRCKPIYQFGKALKLKV